MAVIKTVLAGGVGADIIEGGDAPTGVLVDDTNLAGIPVTNGDGLVGGVLEEVVTIVDQKMLSFKLFCFGNCELFKRLIFEIMTSF